MLLFKHNVRKINTFKVLSIENYVSYFVSFLTFFRNIGGDTPLENIF